MPGLVPSPSELEARAYWQRLAEDGRRMGERSGGAEAVEPEAFRFAARKPPAFPCERGDALAARVEEAFQAAAAAMLGAHTPERIAIAAPLLVAASQAVLDMLDETLRPRVEHARRMVGESL